MCKKENEILLAGSGLRFRLSSLCLGARRAHWRWRELLWRTLMGTDRGWRKLLWRRPLLRWRCVVRTVRVVVVVLRRRRVVVVVVVVRSIFSVATVAFIAVVVAMVV